MVLSYAANSSKINMDNPYDLEIFTNPRVMTEEGKHFKLCALHRSKNIAFSVMNYLYIYLLLQQGTLSFQFLFIGLCETGTVHVDLATIFTGFLVNRV